ncbi:MAG: SsrA-binding protein SmpB [Verrucomicrobia bacterium]|nr:SsrA-binding protein SmpB [Verrucomicrobiota bacterium]
MEILNRKARHDFEILETCEAGIALRGTEVKSIRMGNASLLGAFARVDRGEVWLIGAHIDEYAQGNRFNHEPTRFRKLLLHRSEIRRLHEFCDIKGCTLAPLRIYFNNRGIAKVQLAVCRGKSAADRRQDIRKRDAEREMRQAMKRRRG